MREQAARDQVTIEIATGIVLFVLILVVGGLALWLTHAAGGRLDTSVVRIVGIAVFGVASIVAVRHVYRHRQP